ncbi:hypothetical protein HZS_7468 [Henneguya salminicola]|nr:hypothetical protein HZS_7468 [Henneguya salminicola]
MSLWVDRYKPKRFEDLDYHKSQAEYLTKLVERDDFPHILLYGPMGSGKKTRLSCILRGLYGSHVEKLKLESMTFQVPSGKKVEINVISSSYHIELNPR